MPAQDLKGQDNAFFFKGHLPAIKFRASEYLDAYGVGKRETERGRYEYNANERAEALRDLHDKSKLFAYDRKYWVIDKKGRNEEHYDVIRTVRPLITITEGYQALTRSERDQVIYGDPQAVDEKLTVIALKPCPALVDQITRYFVLKPANYRQEIRLLVSHASKYVYNRYITDMENRGKHGDSNGRSAKLQYLARAIREYKAFGKWMTIIEADRQHTVSRIRLIAQRPKIRMTYYLEHDRFEETDFNPLNYLESLGTKNENG